MTFTMAAGIIKHGWHMVGEVEQLDDTMIVVHSGNYGQCEITTVNAYVEDRWDVENRGDVLADERYRLGVRYETEEHMRGGGVQNTRTDYDPYPSLHTERPTAEDVANLSREMAVDLAHNKREQRAESMIEEST